MKYAQFNNEGFPIAFYDNELNDIPSTAVQITTDQWREFIENQGQRQWDGSNVIEYVTPFDPERVESDINLIVGLVITEYAGSQTEQTNRLMLGLETQNQLRKGPPDQGKEDILDAVIAVGTQVELVLAKSQELIESYVALGEFLTQDDLATIKIELVAAGGQGNGNGN